MKMPDIFVFNKKGTVNVNHCFFSCQGKCSKFALPGAPALKALQAGACLPINTKNITLTAEDSIPVSFEDKVEIPVQQKLSCINYLGNIIIQVID